ncbi:hypothetical protein HNY73_007481 [Argiope bruennichi]|uniref:DUF4817 domain-containing protein n=1 Tax=Argiope bruennichi TaxID=94029 RepID=A0A8T0FJJ8_ARGBR|nr:hypothetical protein HNY73_007481 [Argiope bruennichi]
MRKNKEKRTKFFLLLTDDSTFTIAESKKPKIATLSEKSFCVLEYARVFSTTTVQRAFRIQYGKESPTNKSILRWYKQFKETGCLCKKKSSGRPSLTNDTVEKVRESFVRRPRKSTRVAGRELGMPHQTPRRLMPADGYAISRPYSRFGPVSLNYPAPHGYTFRSPRPSSDIPAPVLCKTDSSKFQRSAQEARSGALLQLEDDGREFETDFIDAEGYRERYLEYYSLIDKKLKETVISEVPNTQKKFKLPKLELRRFDGDPKEFLSFWSPVPKNSRRLEHP